MNTQICIAKNMFKSFGTFLSNVPEYVEETREARLVVGEYEIYWYKNNPTQFFVTKMVVTPGTDWIDPFLGPDTLSVVELKECKTLTEAVLFVAEDSLRTIFKDYSMLFGDQ